MLKRRSFLALVLALGLHAAAQEAPKPAPYGDPATIDPKAVLPSPPDNNSDATEKELEVIFQAQATRTPEQVARIQAEEHYSVNAFANVVGPVLSQATSDKMPATAALLRRVEATATPVAEAAKDDFKRPGPFAVNSRVFPAIQRPTESSYPSAHSTRATIDALVLAQLVPDQKNAILARGREIGDDRVIAGVQFPSDVIAGRVLGKAVFEQMMQDPQFQADLAAAKAEVVEAVKRR
jgi:acid phosphatase (class A)